MDSTLDITCSDRSKQAREALIGTAPRADYYLLVEYDGAWETKAFEASSIPGAVKAGLTAALKALPNSRLLLIRDSQEGRKAGIHFFFADVRPAAQALFAWSLDRYDDLLDIDLTGVVDGKYDSNRQNPGSQLFLTCTNGRRDPCCARQGPAIYAALRQAAGQAAWQCSHIGGHRFAGNVLCLPSGVLYGRLDSTQVAGLSQALMDETILLAYFRGRVGYPEPVQAAEYFLRQKTAQPEDQVYHFIEFSQVAENHWLVKFKDEKKGQIYSLQVIAQTGPEIYQSCRVEKPVPIVNYKLLEII